MSSIVSLAKRRGFVFQNSEIYGGLGSVWDYGPIGAELKRNVRNAWWQHFVSGMDNVVGLESAILMHSDVWKASGHIGSFSDLLTECPKCNTRYKADDLKDDKCAKCSTVLGAPREFNLMFESHIGPLRDDAARIYLRPETAQGIFVNFGNVTQTSRMRVPFGIGQIGKAFRNEITPGNFTFRTREFEQMELEFFCHPKESEQWYKHWIQTSMDWFQQIGIRAENLRERVHKSDELPHYALGSTDIEYQFPWGWGELESIANRSDHDLKSHSELAGKDLSYIDPTTNERFIPHIVEPSMGADRTALALLIDAYAEEQINDDTRVVLRFHPSIAPFKVAVLPLSRKEPLVKLAKKVYDIIRPVHTCQYDDTQSIGRRYRRQDEIGTYLCVTVDFESVESDNAVTIRNRDTTEQTRVAIPNLLRALEDSLKDKQG